VPRAQQQPCQGVYRLDPETAALARLADDFDQPNGLCFSLDERRLFVNDSPRGHIRVFNVQGDGTLAGGEVWAELRGEEPGMPDGLKLDAAGNLYCTGPGGIHVFDPSATCLGVIRVPEQTANFCWGGADLRDLLIGGSTTLYRVRVLIAGRLAGS
jgi:gluconolactonase